MPYRVEYGCHMKYILPIMGSDNTGWVRWDWVALRGGKRRLISGHRNITSSSCCCNFVPQTAGPEIYDIYQRPSGAVKEGHSAALFCEARGEPSPTIHWTWDADTQPIPTPTIKFSSVSRNEAGLYTCHAENGIGTPNSKPLELKVQCRSMLYLYTLFSSWRTVYMSLCCRIFSESRNTYRFQISQRPLLPSDT